MITYELRRGRPQITVEEAENPELFGKALLEHYNKIKVESYPNRLFISCERKEVPDPEPEPEEDEFVEVEEYEDDDYDEGSDYDDDDEEDWD